MATNQVRVLTINVNENRQDTLYRLEKGWSLRFTLGPSLHACPVRIFCNHPPSKAVPYERKKFYELPWKSFSGSKSDNHDAYTEVSIVIAGSFNYFFTIDESDNIEKANGQGYFLVDPTLSMGLDEEEMTLDCIQCQTVLSKCLGPFDEWEGRLWVAKETGYNLVHFTPIQDLGQSYSAYSIQDQLKLNPAFNNNGKKFSFEDVGNLVRMMERDWKMLSLTDLVYNHTADNSPWLQEHPECAYNLHNSPYLKPAYLMDRILAHFSDDVADGKFTEKGIPPKIVSEVHIQAIRETLLTHVIPSHKLEEFFTVNADEVLKRFRHGILENRLIASSDKELDIIQDPLYQRKQCRVDMDTALKLYNIDRPGVVDRNQRITVCCEELQRRLDHLNGCRIGELNDHINTAVMNYVDNVRWRFLNPNGPKIGIVTKKEPLMHNYFIVPDKYQGSITVEENYMHGESANFIFASNGWVMGDDPLRNFAESGSNVYLRRELIAWGDSAKLRYGQTEADCPYLWQRMREYTETTARIFHGIRLDNCHSTPIHVAEYMMDAARRIRPDLYVVAELFTGGEHLDNLFMNRLGINSLIREALSARDAHDLGRLVHRFGGQPVGAFIQPRVQPLVPTVAHALFFDQTHDNESPIQKHSAFDLLPSSALVAMASCATGSNRGYDQMVPHHIHVVTEDRKYTSWADCQFPGTPHINQSFGITKGKTLLNILHNYMGRTGFSQVFVDQVDATVVAVTRHNPQTHDSIMLVARTAFQEPADPETSSNIRNLTVQGKIQEILFEIQTCRTKEYKYTKDPEFINGLPEYYLDLQERFAVADSKLVTIKTSDDSDSSVITFKKFTPGSIIAFRTVLPSKSSQAILEIRRGLGQFGYLMRSYSGRSMFDSTVDKSNFRSIVSDLTLADLNRVLFRCHVEEMADGNGIGVYNIPGYGEMPFCGLRGVMTVLGAIRSKNDLGHPLCNNLREGNWLPSYMANRLKFFRGTENLAEWFEKIFSHLAEIPHYLKPCYFDAIVTGAYVVLRQHAFSLMSEFVQDGSIFVQALAMGSVMFCGYVKNARLPFLSPDLAPPLPPVMEFEGSEGTYEEQAPLTLSAGFPHFCSGYLRSWGRDTFIALRGLLLLTDRFQEARYIILGFAGCLRHGLIPNLLNEGVGARFNCRDGTWWWLQAIQEYCKRMPDGASILKDKVSRLYPNDQGEMAKPGEHDQPLYEVMQEALQCHATGVQYREYNAGTQIDDKMSYEGFNNEIGVKWKNGFVYGGNVHNCGTWMDMMGSSDRAGNKGKPATPRDGSAVEIVGLSASAALWLADMHKQGLYPYEGVKIKTGDSEEFMTFGDWANLIKANFEKCFWINTEPQPDEESPELIVRRGMYMDTYWATQFWANYQLRPNTAIAMVHAPWLFTPEKAWIALDTMRKVLVGPLGMKTLDPSDWSYVSFYDNTDSDDPKTANGYSYHMGPEWTWPIGFFLRAKLHFAKILNKDRPGLLKETVGFVKSTLTRHYQEVMTSPWRSLPELTNADGQPNYFGCAAQAWSMSCVLEVLHDLENLDTTTGLSASKSTEDLVAPV